MVASYALAIDMRKMSYVDIDDIKASLFVWIVWPIFALGVVLYWSAFLVKVLFFRN